MPKYVAQNFAKEQNLLFMETSAFHDTNVRDCFETLVQEIYTVQNSLELNNKRPTRPGGNVIIVNDPPGQG